MIHNSVSSRPIHYAHDWQLDQDWAGFDALPPWIKAAVHEAPTNWDAGQLARLYRQVHADVDLILQIIAENNATELLEWTRDYHARHGCLTPAFLACATPQRYGTR
jgi:hypothetical protein